ncbi:MAG: YdcF family protein [Thermaurantiacus sp.]|uniref:YdcF family protein n=1 Tax=Thermaurantiacus sp. TaxID=2820283 RepID=UPI00298F3DEC|nr:YdcF family protein [Thermaurantiacus sp.]MDW8415823.1 YdcF family protein [Thermaurantiacus sp.]
MTLSSARTRRRRSGLRVARGLAWMLGLALLALALGFGLYAGLRPGPAPYGVATDGVVVLTGGPGRLARGAEVLQAGLAQRLLVSGVNPSVRPGELRAALGLPLEVFARRVDIGFAADSTRTNAAEVAAWVSQHRLRSVRIVTSDYHAWRARAEIAARLPEGVGIVVDAVPSRVPWRQLAREYSKLLAAQVRLWLQGPS